MGKLTVEELLKRKNYGFEFPGYKFGFERLEEDNEWNKSH